MAGLAGQDSGEGGEGRRKVFQVPISSLLTDDCALLKRKFVEKKSPTFSSFREVLGAPLFPHHIQVNHSQEQYANGQCLSHCMSVQHIS